MTASAKTKHYPVEFGKLMADRFGDNVTSRCMWQERGPKDTNIAWIECWCVWRESLPPRALLVQTYTDSDGWEVFMPSTHLAISKTLDEVFAFCGKRS